MINEFQKPFYHAIIDNFLPEEALVELKNTYNTTHYKEIASDLFRFMQTKELNTDKRLDTFKTHLDSLFEKYHSLDGRFYDIFASYYRKGDYLLCHDDLIDNRIYAFSFYLEDYTSGELIIYENDCITENRLIEVKENRLAIFEVSKLSYHEVAMCFSDGRKAITGWFNHKSKLFEHISMERPLSIPENIEYYDLDLEITDQITCLDFEDIDTKEISRQVSGPFIDRRCASILLETLYVPDIPEYTLIHAEYLFIDKNGYILCNDRINNQNVGILDIFIVKTDRSVENYFKLVSESGDIEAEIDAIDNQMVIIKRNHSNICITRVDAEVYLYHFIYKHD